MRSLTLRLAALTALWVAAGLAVTGWFVSGMAERQIEAAADARLSAMMDAVIAGLSTDPAGRPRLERSLGDTEFERPLSGRYWRVAGRGGVASSRSLWDADLPPPLAAAAGPGAPAARDVHGPRGERLRLLERTVEIPGAADPLAVQVAASRDATDAEVSRLRRGIGLAFGLLGLGLVGGVAVLAVWGLRPLGVVRQALTEVRAGTRDRLAAVPVPPEIAPLVEEVDALLAQNQATVERARAHVGNLAHALKTPVAVLVNALGEADPRLGLALAQARAIERTVQHHLARARSAALSGGPGSLAGRGASPLAAAQEVAAALRRLQAERGLSISVDGDAALRVRADRQDLIEIVGNLMENACNWAVGRVEVRIAPVQGDGRRPEDLPGRMVALVVEDDGPGLPEDRPAAAAVSRGERLDEAVPGTGLGLAIAADLAGLHGGRLILGRSVRLSGASAQLQLPAAADAPHVPAR